MRKEWQHDPIVMVEERDKYETSDNDKGEALAFKIDVWWLLTEIRGIYFYL